MYFAFLWGAVPPPPPNARFLVSGDWNNWNLPVSMNSNSTRIHKVFITNLSSSASIWNQSFAVRQSNWVNSKFTLTSHHDFNLGVYLWNFLQIFCRHTSVRTTVLTIFYVSAQALLNNSILKQRYSTVNTHIICFDGKTNYRKKYAYRTLAKIKSK